jgi:hypothetical protein
MASPVWKRTSTLSFSQVVSPVFWIVQAVVNSVPLVKEVPSTGLCAMTLHLPAKGTLALVGYGLVGDLVGLGRTNGVRVAKINGVRLGIGVALGAAVATPEVAEITGVSVHVGGSASKTSVGVEDGNTITGTGVDGGNGFKAELGSAKMIPTIPAIRQTPNINKIDNIFQMDDDFILTLCEQQPSGRLE